MSDTDQQQPVELPTHWDAEAYILAYDDLQQAAPANEPERSEWAAEHYRNSGHREGREVPAPKKEEENETQPPAQEEEETKPVEEEQKQEEEQQQQQPTLPDHWNSEAYIQAYDDLVSAAPADEPERSDWARDHYINCGHGEGRQCPEPRKEEEQPATEEQDKPSDEQQPPAENETTNDDTNPPPAEEENQTQQQTPPPQEDTTKEEEQPPQQQQDDNDTNNAENSRYQGMTREQFLKEMGLTEDEVIDPAHRTDTLPPADRVEELRVIDKSDLVDETFMKEVDITNPQQVAESALIVHSEYREKQIEKFKSTHSTSSQPDSPDKHNQNSPQRSTTEAQEDKQNFANYKSKLLEDFRVRKEAGINKTPQRKAQVATPRKTEEQEQQPPPADDEKPADEQ